jgi:ppGpp synthetase/RelA/SpoT-type nucleotidyltranferase
LIEIQLRTPWQQEWATLVEDIDGAMRLTLKDESGPDELLRYLRALAYAQWEQHGLGELSRRAHGDLEDAQAGAEVWLRSRGASR